MRAKCIVQTCAQTLTVILCHCRTGAHGTEELLSFAAALHQLCASEFDRLCSLQPPRDPSICQGSNDENQENEVQQQGSKLEQSHLFSELEPAVEPEVEYKRADVCSHPASGEPSGHTQETIQQLLTLQLFIACLYTQDVVPEEFVHKVLDYHRFSGGPSWPSELRFAGLGSAVEMLSFCGKRLEKLGALKHVMPDLYSFLGDVVRDPACPQKRHSQISHVLELRENGWVVEAFEDTMALHDPPVLGS
jgi:hypothetical protein